MRERSASRRYGRLDDSRLAALVREGDARAFEALYDRHQRGAPRVLPPHARQPPRRRGRAAADLPARPQGAEPGPAPDAMRPWLFAIARNRCLRPCWRATQSSAQVPEDFEPRLRRPRRGRRAPRRPARARRTISRGCRTISARRWCSFELGGSSHEDIAQVLACPPAKVKALVFQARTSLIAERDARSTPCEAIREQLADARGGVLRRGPLRRHLRECAPCDAYRLAVAAPARRSRVAAPGHPERRASRQRCSRQPGCRAAAGPRPRPPAVAPPRCWAEQQSAAAVPGRRAASAVTALVAKVAVTVAVAGAGVSAAVAAVGSTDGVQPAPVRVSHPTQTRAAQPRPPATHVPSPARARPPARAATESPPVTTPPRVVVRARADPRHRARAAARRHRLRVLLRQTAHRRTDAETGNPVRGASRRAPRAAASPASRGRRRPQSRAHAASPPRRRPLRAFDPSAPPRAPGARAASHGDTDTDIDADSRGPVPASTETPAPAQAP